MKIMAVDYGDAHTGLAVCDRTEFLASPIGTIHQKNIDKVASDVANAAIEYEVNEIIVGNPINMDGTLGERAAKCGVFSEKLKSLTDIPVRLWDERSTTVSAHNILNEVNVRGKERKKIIDTVAAVVILESYMEFRKNSTK